MNWSDFLARPRLPVPSESALHTFARESILITGAGGSIGSALARRLASLKPAALALLDSSESSLFELQQALAEKEATMLLGNVCDSALLDEAFAAYRPRIVFHAAAFKHVPLMEEQPLAAIANNIFGTLSVASAAQANRARIVLLSTDKAVAPSSVLGATKRVAEQIVLKSGGTVLRLGNVLATRGSVAETFARQIALGGPLTITDRAARRYFLTLDEAVDLLLIAVDAQDDAVLLAPELAGPHPITDLAQFMARTLEPDRKINMRFSRLRPGDKESEQLWSEAEHAMPSGLPGLMHIAAPEIEEARLQKLLHALRTATDARDIGAAVAHLCTLVPDYTPGTALMALATQKVGA